MRRTLGITGIAVQLLFASCAAAPRWQAEDRPETLDVRVLLESKDPGALFRHMHLARALIEPLRDDYDQILVYVNSLGDDSDLPARRIQ